MRITLGKEPRKWVSVTALATLTALFVSACSVTSLDEVVVSDHHDAEEASEEILGTTTSALVANDPVSSAVAQSCSTTAVKELATQLVQEIQCMKPGSMMRIDNTPGLALGSAVFPSIQTNVATALVNAQKARGVTMSINSGLRTLPQQYLLYRWYQTGRCGIGLAASPGTSNHESGIAVDINDNAAWRSAMTSKNFHWLGASDPVHYDFVGGGTIDMKGLSVLAFQKLWNRNNPNDKIPEDSDYGTATEQRLAKSPVGGFAIGALCTPSSNTPPGTPAAPGSPDAPSPEATKAPGSSEAPSSQPSSESSESTTTSASVYGAPRVQTAEQSGCTLSSSRSTETSSSTSLLGIALAGLMIAARRRRRAR